MYTFFLCKMAILYKNWTTWGSVSRSFSYLLPGSSWFWQDFVWLTITRWKPPSREGALHKRSAMLAHLLVMRLPRLGRLSAQCWPNFLLGQFNINSILLYKLRYNSIDNFWKTYKLFKFKFKLQTAIKLTNTLFFENIIVKWIFAFWNPFSV